MKKLSIKYSKTFIELCDYVGSCQPVTTYIKNEHGWSFQRQWNEKQIPGWNTQGNMMSGTILIIGSF